jgi:tetratricopeptide (TPR) repeat protein
VSGPIFEQYKAALRRGHLAALDARLEDALEAYREAAGIVPERALPHASQGTLLHRLDRWPEAMAAFEAALRLAPDDEGSLRARAAARHERGLRSGAADDLERLAHVLDVAGRTGEAAEAARQASAIEASPARAALLERLAQAVDRRTEAEAAAAAMDEPVATDEPAAFAAPIAAPDAEAVMANAMHLLDSGETSAARDLMLMAALIHRQAGRLDAALDVCFQLLGFTPSDPQVHLAIANVQLDHGWTPLAREKLELLQQLTGLIGDTQAAADASALAAERLHDEPVHSGTRS